MTVDQLHELAERRDGHYAVESAGRSIHIYMIRDGRDDQLVATRSTPASALAYIRAARLADRNAADRTRRECQSLVDRVLEAGRPSPTLTPSGS